MKGAGVPIDWTRPLRTLGPERWPARVLEIKPERGEFCIRVEIHGGGTWLSRDGRCEGFLRLVVENVPMEPEPDDLRSRRGLTAAEIDLLERLRARLACSVAEIDFGLHEGTVDHALPALTTLSGVHTGAVVLRALLEGR